MKYPQETWGGTSDNFQYLRHSGVSTTRWHTCEHRPRIRDTQDGPHLLIGALNCRGVAKRERLDQQTLDPTVDAGSHVVTCTNNMH